MSAIQLEAVDAIFEETDGFDISGDQSSNTQTNALMSLAALQSSPESTLTTSSSPSSSDSTAPEEQSLQSAETQDVLSEALNASSGSLVNALA